MPGCMLHYRYLNAAALEEYFAGKDNVDDIKKASLDVCLHLIYYCMNLEVYYMVLAYICENSSLNFSIDKFLIC